MVLFRALLLVLMLSSVANAGQTVLCTFRDLPTPDRIQVILRSPENGTLQYLSPAHPSPSSDTPLELKRIADHPEGFAQFDVPNPNVRMTFKIPADLLMANAVRFRGILSSVIESMNLTQDQELLCDATLDP
jgi:hypothetical protein